MVLFCGLLAIGPIAPAWGQSPVLAWKTQLGTSAGDYAQGVAVDSAGNVYITGSTYGSLGGTNQGGQDAFLAKYSSAGSLAWKTQLGTPINATWARGVAVDSAGNAYITGLTGGSLGGTNQWSYDAFLVKYDSAGNLTWKTQLGSSSDDDAYGVALDNAGNAYITGRNLAKYSSTGSLLWQTQVASLDNGLGHAYGLVLDSAGNAYVTGYWEGTETPPYGYADDYAFLDKYSSTGSLVWSKPVAHDGQAIGVAVDSAGNAYITGYVGTHFNMGHPNAMLPFLAKFDSAGSVAWETNLGSSYMAYDYALGVAVDGVGNAYITGSTDGNLGGTNQGYTDAFLAKYSSTGSLVWKTQLGSSNPDGALGVAVDGVGNAYITGYTWGSLGGTNQGSYDAFLVKYEVPRPILDGDANRDGVVSFDDYILLANNFGQSSATWQMGDFNGDGKVSFADYILLANNFGQHAPEPATLALLALGGLAMLRRRK